MGHWISSSGCRDESIAIACLLLVEPSCNTHAGTPTLLNVTVSPAESTAVDMYLLMDLSLTMIQDLNNLRTTSGMLGKLCL